MVQFNANLPVQSLYLHWPFCPYKCNFCPFIALAGQDAFMEQYHAALKREIVDYAQGASKSAIKTIFIGGGTPSTYPLPLLRDLVATLHEHFIIDPEVEFSIEVNPGTVTQEKLETWKLLGINRLSIGVQSLNDEVLKKLNRHQKAEHVYALIESASKLFDNISVDLIIGLPGVSDTEWKELIEQIVRWPIKHVSTYFLTVHEDTPLYFGVKLQKIILPSDDMVVDAYHWTRDMFSKHGIEQYEISNFSAPGYHSRHNSNYWTRNPYKAFGLGACSFDGISRFQNEKNLLKYLQAVSEGKEPYIFSEVVSEKETWLEELMLGLRQIKGVSIEKLKKLLKGREEAIFKDKVEELCQMGFVQQVQGMLCLTPSGLAVANEVAVKLSEFNT